MLKRFETLLCTGLIAIFLLTSIGCSSMTPQQKEALGTTLGTVLGGVVGSQVGSGEGRVVATVLGAGIGAFIGNRLSKHLNEREQQEVNTIVNDQLDSDARASGERRWRSDDGQKTVDIRTSETFGRNQIGQVASTQEVSVNDNQMSQLPADAKCRYSSNRVSVEQEPQAEQGTLYCRTASGNWIPVGSRTTVLAQNS